MNSSEHRKRSQFHIALGLAFLVEAAGYLALPYLALHLRESFKISEAAIGTYFSIGIWLRPVWAMSTAFLSSRIRTSKLIQTGALISAVSIGGLALSTDPTVGLFSIIFANLGLSVWSPSIYAYVYDLFGNQSETKKQISQLNFVTYSGAAVGSSVAALLAASQRNSIFLISVICFFFVALFSNYLKTSAHAVPATTAEPAKPSHKFSLSFEVVLIAIATVTFWASYAQFNTYFSLFAADWLNQAEVVGFAFSFLTIVVALLSLAIAKFQFLQRYSNAISIGIIAICSAAWFLVLTNPSMPFAIAFLVALALAEAFFVVVITHLWASQSQKSQFVQSLNYSLCNVGMGSGALLGGYLYKTPQQGSLLPFAGENLTLMLVAAITLLMGLALTRKSKSNDLLKPFEVGTISEPELTIYCFQKSDLLGSAELGQIIVEYCEHVQDKIWTKKFETSDNSIAQDFLFLAFDKRNNTPAAFFSGSIFKTESKTFLYISDAMIMPRYRGGDLLAYFFKKANSSAQSQHPNSEIINIVASGYINIFTSLETKDYFERTNWPPEDTDLKLINEIIHGSFEDASMEANGIIRSGWCKQHNNMKDVWPNNMASKYEFPLDVNYFNGDVLVRLYRYKGGQ